MAGMLEYKCPCCDGAIQFDSATQKMKCPYPDYRKARNEMQELVRAQKNVERFFAEEKDTTEKTQTH